MLCLVLGCVGRYWAHRVLIPCTDLVPIRTGHSYSLPSSVLRLGEVRVSPGRGGKGVPDKKQPVGELGSQRRASVLGNNTLWGAGTGLEGAVGAWSAGGCGSLLQRHFHHQPGVVTQNPDSRDFTGQGGAGKLKCINRDHLKAHSAPRQILALTVWKGLIPNPAQKHQGDLEDLARFYSYTKNRILLGSFQMSFEEEWSRYVTSLGPGTM